MKSSKSIEEWLHFASVSASTLFLTTGAINPTPLCLCYGNKACSTTGEELIHNYTGWQGAKTQSEQIA